MHQRALGLCAFVALLDNADSADAVTMRTRTRMNTMDLSSGSLDAASPAMQSPGGTLRRLADSTRLSAGDSGHSSSGDADAFLNEVSAAGGGGNNYFVDAVLQSMAEGKSATSSPDSAAATSKRSIAEMDNVFASMEGCRGLYEGGELSQCLFARAQEWHEARDAAKQVREAEAESSGDDVAMTEGAASASAAEPQSGQSESGFFSALLQHDQISCLSFDCDGTLMNTMNYYWKTWDSLVKHYRLILD